MSRKHCPGDEVVLSYHDCLLRRDDVDLLRGSHWLNDAVIGFYFEYLDRKCEEAETTENRKKIHLVGPELTQLLKLTEPSDYPALLDDSRVKERDYVFFPLNNCDSREAAGGTHWSLLVFSRKEKTFIHLDSCRGTNKHVATSFVAKITNYLSDGEAKIFHDTDSPQQDNGYDCGLFILCEADALLRHLRDNDEARGCNFGGVKSAVGTKRRELLELIDELKNTPEKNR